MFFSEEFRPEESSDDDEGTIAREDDNPEEQASELQLLHEESKQTMEDLLKELPPGYLDGGDFSPSNSIEDLTSLTGCQDSAEEKEEDVVKEVMIGQEVTGEKEEKDSDSICEGKIGKELKRRRVKLKPSENISESEKDIGDQDFKVEESDEDDEGTIEEQENNEGKSDHQQELDDLQVCVFAFYIYS